MRTLQVMKYRPNTNILYMQKTAPQPYLTLILSHTTEQSLSIPLSPRSQSTFQTKFIQYPTMACSDCIGHKHCIDPITPLDHNNSSSKECPFADRGTCKPCQELPTIEEDIRRTSERLKNLLARHRHLTTETNHFHSPIIRDLPIEVLCKIFQAYLPEDLSVPKRHYYFPRDRLSRIALPLKLGAVCRTWRQAAWSTPSLWTRIYVNLVDKKAAYSENQCDILEKWVQRSGSLPVDVYVSEGCDIFTNDDHHAGLACLRVLVQCANRWRDVDLHPRRRSIRYLFSQAAEIVPRTLKLRNLVITRHRGSKGGKPDSGSMLDAWSHCKLRPQQLEIERCWPGRSDNLDWSSLTKLRATSWTRDEFLDVLRHAPNLQSCHLEHLSGPYATTISSESHVQHDRIQQLSINFWNRADTIVDFIITPNLRDFHCDSSRDVNMSLSTFFARSSFPLTRLDLCLGSYTSTSLISLLDMVPLLEHLTLSLKSSDEAVIGSFLKHMSSTTMSPCTSEVDDADVRHFQNSTNRFLPHLQCLIFKGEFRFPWLSAHRALGVPSNFGKPGWRPLKSLIVQHRSEAALPENWVDRDTVARLVELRNVGAVIAYDVVGRDQQITSTINWEDYL